MKKDIDAHIRLSALYVVMNLIQDNRGQNIVAGYAVRKRGRREEMHTAARKHIAINARCAEAVLHQSGLGRCSVQTLVDKLHTVRGPCYT